MNASGSVLPKILEKGLSERKLFTEALFKRPESLSQFLPYEEYLDKFGIFINKDGSFGAVYRAQLVEHEPLVGPRVAELVANLKTWFSLPENCVLQVLYDQSPVAYHDSRWQEMSETFKYPHPVSKTLFDKRLNMFRESYALRSLKRPLKREVYVSIRYFPSNTVKNDIQNMLRSDDRFLFEEMKGFVREVKAFGHILEQFKSYSNVELEKLCDQALADYLRRFFNPREYYKRAFAPVNRHRSLSDQLIFNSPTLDYDGIDREGIRTRTLSLKTSPLVAYPGGMAYFTKLNFPFKLSLNFSFPTQRKAKSFFDIKEFFLQNTPSEKAKIQKAEIQEVQHRLARGDKCLFLPY